MLRFFFKGFGHFILVLVKEVTSSYGTGIYGRKAPYGLMVA